jgi:ornithine cyclodeaminase/alanine dehydrogenase-like protein (mu-crystallin family)
MTFDQLERKKIQQPCPQGADALLLSRSTVERLLTPDECIAAVEDAFRQYALGKTPAPGILAMHVQDGSFHVKAGLLRLDRPYFAAKLNANFPHNGARQGLPTIQGIVALCDAANGVPLAVMDSMALTALRTAAATAVAAKYLAREHSEAVLICGCGRQARAQLRALLRVRAPTRIRTYDQDAGKAAAFAASLESETAIERKRSEGSRRGGRSERHRRHLYNCAALFHRARDGAPWNVRRQRRR